MKLYRYVCVLLVMVMALAAASPAFAAAQTQTIVDLLASDRRFSTLAAAVNAAGLSSTLSGTGPFTVFAPTNAAFNKLGKKTIDALLADPAKLSSILLYHAVSGREMAADVVETTSYTTAQGEPVVVKVRNGKVYINNARVVQTDLEASNGVVHVIDTVLQPPTRDIVDTAAANPKFSTLVAAVEAAGLTSTLKGAGPFTVFAPTNAAFNKLGKSTIDALLADPAKLGDILKYHVISGEVFSGDARKLSHAATVNGAEVAFQAKNGGFFINNVRISMTDIQATNGVIHVIDAVIQPPSMDIVDTLAGRKNFSTLAAAVEAAGLTSTLKGAGPFTIFAPTNAAFNKLGKKTIDALLADPAQLASILQYHVVSGRVYSADAMNLSHAATVNGADLAFSQKRGGFYANNARIVSTDILTTNGVIHVIDAVMLPPSHNLVDTLSGRKEFSTLVAAVEAAGLTDTLKGAGPYTIFAPTNAAFNKLGKKTVDALLADPTQLASILQYHVVSGRVYSGDVVELSSATTLNGEDVHIEVRRNGVYINNARVVATNILTTNGVIHVIDTVLVPPAP